MNRRPPGLLTEKAIQGFLQYKAAEALSPRTVESYKRDLEQWAEYASEVYVSKVTTADLRGYLVWLRTEYKPRRITGREGPLSPKTIRNVWVSLSAFFNWASVEFNIPSPMKAIPGPKFETAPVEPFTREQVEVLLKACQFSDEARTDDRRRFIMRRATWHRDEAILLTLLDAGLRASELCSLVVGDVDKKSGKLQIRHGEGGGAKGGKGRTVYLGKAARRALWRYLTEREDGEDPDAPLFLAEEHIRHGENPPVTKFVGSSGCGKDGFEHLP